MSKKQSNPPPPPLGPPYRSPTGYAHKSKGATMKNFIYSILAATCGVVCAYFLIALVIGQFPVHIESLGYSEQKASELVLVMGGCLGLLIFALWGDDE